MHFHPGYDAQALLAAHREWARQYADPLAAGIGPHANDRAPDRPLRIGYVSPDFRTHPVGRFVAPLLESHSASVSVYCYSSVSVPDETTERCRAVSVWCDARNFSDRQLADQIREDGIDILVDLSMHVIGNRLLTFARKPAPVQVTYLAYCGTTGLGTMDYRLTDGYFDPPGTDDDYTERSIRLPHSYWCYEAPENSPYVGPLPARRNGFVTFGCLNNFAKVSVPTLEAWARVLQAVPGSRLLIHAQEGTHRDRVRIFFSHAGVDPDRVQFVKGMPLLDYLHLHNLIDIALDPFPYAGGTTTLDALWMGVPVVTLAGRTAVGRGGVSILSNVGLPELIARTPDEYVDIAALLAADQARLVALRGGLRPCLRASPVMNAAGFARDLEAAYREMWTVARPDRAAG
jgi:protein O-GlcNAc transferase